MTIVHTPYGRGRIIEKSGSRVRVEGEDFSIWLSSRELLFDWVEDNSEEEVNPDLNTTLPYDPSPQFLPDSNSTIQPGQTVDVDERLQESLSVEAELSDKYAKLRPIQDPSSLKSQLERNPELTARKIAESFGEPTTPEPDFSLLSHPKYREAAWKDVRAKAVRLRREGKVSTSEITPRAIVARVEGDNGTYDTVVVRAGATIGAGSITEWGCSCEWGKWAFKRQHTYVGRLCSHAYAAYMELQSSAPITHNPDVVKKKRVRSPKNPYRPALLPSRSSSLNVEETAYFPKTHYHEMEDVTEDARSYGEYDPEEDVYRVGSFDEEIEYEGWTSSKCGDGYTITSPGGDHEFADHTSIDDSEAEGYLQRFVDGLSDHERQLYASKTAHVVCPDSGFYAHYTQGPDGGLVLGIYNPLDQLVEVVEPLDGEEYAEGEDEEALKKFLKKELDKTPEERPFMSRRTAGLLEDFYEENLGEWDDLDAFENYVVQKRLTDEEADELDRRITKLEEYSDSGGRDYGYMVQKIDGINQDYYSFREPGGFSGSGPRPVLVPETSAERAEREDEMEDVTEFKSARRFIRSQKKKSAGEELWDDENDWDPDFYERAQERDRSDGAIPEYDEIRQKYDFEDEPEVRYYARLDQLPIKFAKKLFYAWCKENGYDPLLRVSQTIIPFQEEVGYLSGAQYGALVHGPIQGSVKPSPKFAGRNFTFKEQMDLINEASSDPSILDDLDLSGTHYI